MRGIRFEGGPADIPSGTCESQQCVPPSPDIDRPLPSPRPNPWNSLDRRKFHYPLLSLPSSEIERWIGRLRPRVEVDLSNERRGLWIVFCNRFKRTTWRIYWNVDWKVENILNFWYWLMMARKDGSSIEGVSKDSLKLVLKRGGIYARCI